LPAPTPAPDTTGFRNVPRWKTAARFLAGAWFALAALAGRAGEPWQEALAGMPLAVPARQPVELGRTNCMPLMLDAFQSNGVVKALIFMPGATDELEFFRRAHAVLTNANPSLLDAVTALTNQTFIQATFHPPLLLLHSTGDSLAVIAVVKSESTAAKLHQRLVPGRVQIEDADWGNIRSKLKGKLSVGLRPFENALGTYHFYRHNFTACGVTDWEMLETLALAGKTTFTVHWLTADFQPDRRAGLPPKLEHFPLK
jgi:hypothetical protein